MMIGEERVRQTTKGSAAGRPMTQHRMRYVPAESMACEEALLRRTSSLGRRLAAAPAERSERKMDSRMQLGLAPVS
jgi:hypothetical protein